MAILDSWLDILSGVIEKENDLPNHDTEWILSELHHTAWPWKMMFMIFTLGFAQQKAQIHGLSSTFQLRVVSLNPKGIVNWHPVYGNHLATFRRSK